MNADISETITDKELGFQIYIPYTEKIMTFSIKLFVFSIWGCTKFKYKICGKTHIEKSCTHFKKNDL